MIALKNIEKVYMTGSARTYVLRRISMTVRAGEFVTIMGPSGAGKSTLLGIIGMLDAEWKGEYYLDDIAVHTLRRRERAALTREQCGLVFQQYHLLDNLTVGENLEVPLTYRSLKRSRREAMVAEMLDRFNLLARKNLYPSQLSGGQQQLVGIARAVIASPKLILADEPTGNLHSEQGREVMELFRDLNRAGTTVIQVTHSDANAAYGDRVVRLFDGWMEHDEMPEGGPASARAAAMW
jgi:ABC-type lipoprotein export system ATPase subunit